MLGHRVLDWTAEQKRKIHEARMQGRLNKAPPIQSRDCSSEGHPSLPREHSIAHSKIAFPKAGEGDRPGLQDRPAIPVGGGTVSPRGSRGIPCRVV